MVETANGTRTLPILKRWGLPHACNHFKRHTPLASRTNVRKGPLHDGTAIIGCAETCSAAATTNPVVRNTAGRARSYYC